MTALRALTEDVEVGDDLLWIGEHAMAGTGDRAYPNEVTHVEREAGTIRVEGGGVRGGQDRFEVDEDGESRAFHEEKHMGPVAVARLTDSRDLVPVVRVFDDIRGDRS